MGVGRSCVLMCPSSADTAITHMSPGRSSAGGWFSFDTLGKPLQQVEGFVCPWVAVPWDITSATAAVGKGDRRATGEAEASSPSPVLQLLPFNAQRPGPEGRQLGRAILSFPSLLLLLLHRQAVGKPSQAALRPGEGRGKVLMALQPWPQGTAGHSVRRCSVLRGGSRGAEVPALGVGSGGAAVSLVLLSRPGPVLVHVSQTGSAIWQAERARSCSLCSKITSPGCASLLKLQQATASTGETARDMELERTNAD